MYVHCTAGLGRAPAACIAYLYWVANDGSLREGSNWSLDKARRCHIWFIWVTWLA